MPCCESVRAWFRAGWGFITLGLALTVVAFLLGVVYFSIRAITTSLEHIDIVPTYATALLICCVGILTLFLYKRRDAMITVPTLVLAIVCVLLTLASFLLLTTKVIHTMMAFQKCQYDVTLHKCVCQTTDITSLVYSEVASCLVVEKNLLHLAYTQCCLFMMAFCFSSLATSFIAYTIHQDRKTGYLLEEEAENYPEPEAEVNRTDSQSYPLIGRYRQILSRQIVLPSGRYHMHNPIGQPGHHGHSTSTHGQFNNPIGRSGHHGHSTSTRGQFNNPIGQSGHHGHSTSTHGQCSGSTQQAVPPDQGQPMGNLQRDGGVSQVYENDREVNEIDNPGTGSSINCTHGTARRGTSATERQLPPPPSPEVMWDGYCRRPQSDIARINRHLNTPILNPSTSPWSFQPILFPPDHSRVHSSRSRSRQRPRQSRHRSSHSRHHTSSQPYVAFVPMPYSMYRPNTLFGMGVSPFPMEPPPPYLSASEGPPPPPYGLMCPAPAYTSRGPSPSIDQCNQESIYENIDI